MDSNLQDHNKIIRSAATFLIIGGLIAILQYFKTFLQPFVVALILWFLVAEVRRYLEKIKIKNKSLPRPIWTLISTVAVFYIFYVITDLIIINFQSLAENAEKYNSALVDLLEKIEDLLGVDNLGEAVQDQHSSIVAWASVAAKALASFVGTLLLVLFYVIFLLLEETAFNKKVQKIYDRSSSKARIKNSVSRISTLLSDYLGIKVLTSFLTGFLSFFVLLFLGIDMPILWAFLIFLLNFIPSVGSIVATSFPVIFSMLQYSGDWGKTLYVFLGVAFVQVLIGNIIEPRILGHKLNLSPLVVILGLTFWGYLWGFIGMLLSVPIDAALMIILSQFKSTRNAAILFSKDGDIEYLIPDESKDP
ncbi:MAG: AI-2E family transporter [Bacteroidota bacterium]